MDIKSSTELLWEGLQQNQHFPEELQGQLALEEGYQIQLAVLDKWLAAGEEQAGWKLAFTAPGPRKMFGAEVPGHGYVLDRGRKSTGTHFDFDGMNNPAVEVELLMTVNQPLAGPGVTVERVREVLCSITPGFEIIERRGDMASDLPLGVADNIFHSAYVAGGVVSPVPNFFSPETVTVEISRNGELFQKSVGADVIDNHYENIAFLANRLGALGRRIEPGQVLLTGSFIPPTPASKGDHWVAKYEGLGEVELHFD